MSPAMPLFRSHSVFAGSVILAFSVAAKAQQAAPPGTAPAAAATTPVAATTPAAAPAAPTGDSWGTPGTPAVGSAPSPASNAPPVYYVETVPTAPPPGNTEGPPPSEGARDAELPLEPQMRMHIEEPPPPPVARHRAPRNAFWVGARAGWWVPFGDLWGACNGSGAGCDSMKFGAVASSGPMMELDLGARLGRNYNVYALWERAQLGKGSGVDGYSQIRADTDFLGLGVRLSTDPDDVGMVLDLALGARRFRAVYEDSNQLQLSQAMFESRLGVGADIRLSPLFSLSPMVTLGLGSFGKADWVTKTSISDAIPANNDTLTHGWLTLQLGGHFDLAGSR